MRFGAGILILVIMLSFLSSCEKKKNAIQHITLIQTLKTTTNEAEVALSKSTATDKGWIDSNVTHLQSSMTISDWGVWVGSVATFLAVFVALFKDVIMGLYLKPILNVSVEMALPDCHIGRTEYSDPKTGTRLAEGNVYYLRLWVSNEGKSPAINVQVFASALYKETGSEEFKKITDFLPMNLRWAHTQEIFRDRIAPKMGRHCDLGHISDPKLKYIHNETKTGVPEDKTTLFLNLEVIPITPFHLLEPGNYRLDLSIAADNAWLTKKTLEITHSGDWFENTDDMFNKGIKLTLR